MTNVDVKKLILTRMIDPHKRIRRPIYRIILHFIVKPYVAKLNVPIIAITGTNGKTTITRLLERIYLNDGYNIGTCTTEGVTHNGNLISEGDSSGGVGVLRAAKCPNVDLLILETARGGIIEFGLGFRKCQVGVVTNLFEDHLGFDGIHTLEQMAEIKSIIPIHTDPEGSIILNGDSAFVSAMETKSKASPIYFVVEKDYEQYKKVFFLEKDYICKKIGSHVEELLKIEEIPLTLKGVQKYNTANVMAALAAIEGMNKFIPTRNKNATKTLKEFGICPYDNFKRFCMLTFRGEKVILGYSKNPESFRRDIEIVKKIKCKLHFEKISGVLTGPGNRQKKYYTDISKIVSHACDFLFIRPPKKKYLRGRSEEEIVQLFSSNIPKGKILSEKRNSLPEIISMTKQEFEGKILFVVFYAALEADIDVLRVLKESKFENAGSYL